MRRAPARLIDLEAFPKDFEEAKLIRVEKLNLLYATLSYCWGDMMPEGSTTTMSNIHRREERMESTGLPQTLRDAFTVTRALGIRYLWVDALCIIQDSREDWELESSKMASIYSNSLVSVAAELSQHCLDGS
ncbi:heterokaryon incompatibility protein-domain-containing protein [Leptodontidium sp. MPI-SDFR-AT-0119]|nr:heterokaryon incompatibility protein-domain-containing protein [Leptodontidium sp. MPI-SDFR-AT-0119]